MSNMLYDPKYGIHEKVEDMSEEHLAYVEDMLFTRDDKKMWKAVAKLC